MNLNLNVVTIMHASNRPRISTPACLVVLLDGIADLIILEHELANTVITSFNLAKLENLSNTIET